MSETVFANQLPLDETKRTVIHDSASLPGDNEIKKTSVSSVPSVAKINFMAGENPRKNKGEIMRIQGNTASIAVIVLFFAVITFNNMLTADKEGPIYDPALDVKTAIKSSLDTAQKEGKHILLMFGGNWCPWCHKLHQLLESDKAIKKFLEENYILVMVDVGEKTDKPLNRDLLDLYRVKGFGYPSLVVLDKKGRLICSQSTGVLEKGKGHDPERVLAFLKAQAPDK